MPGKYEWTDEPPSDKARVKEEAHVNPDGSTSWFARNGDQLRPLATGVDGKWKPAGGPGAEFLYNEKKGRWELADKSGRPNGNLGYIDSNGNFVEPQSPNSPAKPAPEEVYTPPKDLQVAPPPRLKDDRTAAVPSTQNPKISLEELAELQAEELAKFQALEQGALGWLPKQPAKGDAVSSSSTGERDEKHPDIQADTTSGNTAYRNDNSVATNNPTGEKDEKSPEIQADMAAGNTALNKSRPSLSGLIEGESWEAKMAEMQAGERAFRQLPPPPPDPFAGMESGSFYPQPETQQGSDRSPTAIPAQDPYAAAADAAR